MFLQKRLAKLFASDQAEPAKDAVLQKDSEYRRLGEEALHKSWTTLNSSGWTLEKELDNGDTVHVKLVNGRKVFKLTGLVDIPLKLLLDQLFLHFKDIPSWNPTLSLCCTLQAIDPHTDVSYQVVAEAAGGIIAVRDFVNVRHWAVMEEGVYVSADLSIQHPAMPDQQRRIRGENGPGCNVMRPVEGSWDSCTFQWLLRTDPKGWIPKAVLDKALVAAQFQYIENVRKKAKILKEEGLFEEYREEGDSFSKDVEDIQT